MLKLWAKDLEGEVTLAVSLWESTKAEILKIDIDKARLRLPQEFFYF